MRPATSLPGVAVRALHRHGGVGGVNDSGGSTRWSEITETARELALGMAERGVVPGDRVVTDRVPMAGTVAAELAVLANGATVAFGDGRDGTSPVSTTDQEQRPLRWSAAGLAGPWGCETVADLLATGRRVDAAERDRFERLLERVDPNTDAFDWSADAGVTASIDHRAALDLLRSLDRALAPALSQDVETLTVAVAAANWDMTERLLGVWWPMMHGAFTWLEPTAGLVSTIADVDPIIVVAPGAGWSDVADAVRHNPRLSQRSRVGRGVLGTGRAVAAGEVIGRGATALRRLAAATVLPGVRADLGLGRCRLAIALGPTAEHVRRDLLAAGVPLATAWVPHGAPAPVAMTIPGSCDRSSGRPMPGWSITIEPRNRVVADGPGMRHADTHRTGRLDDESRLWLGPSRR